MTPSKAGSTSEDIERYNAPVTYLEGGYAGPEEGIGLCLSGGGYRAMLFHVGVLWRLHEFGLLAKVDRISSVSGGSITAAVLGMNWNRLTASSDPLVAFKEYVVAPIRNMASISIDVRSTVLGVLGPGRVSDKIEKAYRKHLFGSATLQDFPEEPPRFVINATNLQSAVLLRFARKYARDYRVGKIESPSLPLATVVTASSAFPPFLSPAVINLKHSPFEPGTGDDLQKPPFTTKLHLSDGGVYDNLGLETVWKRYNTVFVSDAGGKVDAIENAPWDWFRQFVRVLNVIDNQVRSLRKRQLIASYNRERRSPGDIYGRKGAFWGIRTNIEDYGVPDALECPVKRTTELANLGTRLAKVDRTLQERLINWGYAIADAAVRRWYDTSYEPPPDFPYPSVRV